MNNEPVAWINREEGSGSILDWEKDPYSDTNIPLYTHPAKTLTMAEMEDFINAYGMDMGNIYEFTFAQLTKMIVEIESTIKGEK